MALDTNTIEKIQSVLPKVRVEGTVTENTLLDAQDCFTNYESTVQTDEELTTFRYAVRTDVPCTTDTYVDHPEGPFVEGETGCFTIATEDPAFLVTYSYSDNCEPLPTQVNTFYVAVGVGVAVVAGLLMIVWRKRNVSS